MISDLFKGVGESEGLRFLKVGFFKDVGGVFKIKFKALFKDIGNDFGDIAVRLFIFVVLFNQPKLLGWSTFKSRW